MNALYACDRLSLAELVEALCAAEDIRAFFRRNSGAFTDTTLTEFLHTQMAARRMKKKQIIRRAQIDDYYGYQIFSGMRRPSRNKLLSLAIAMELDLEDCRTLLRLGGVNELYPKNRRDAAILYGIENRLDVFALNELLYDLGEDTLH